MKPKTLKTEFCKIVFVYCLVALCALVAISVSLWSFLETNMKFSMERQLESILNGFDSHLNDLARFFNSQISPASFVATYYEQNAEAIDPAYRRNVRPYLNTMLRNLHGTNDVVDYFAIVHENGQVLAEYYGMYETPFEHLGNLQRDPIFENITVQQSFLRQDPITKEMYLYLIKKISHTKSPTQQKFHFLVLRTKLLDFFGLFASTKILLGEYERSLPFFALDLSAAARICVKNGNTFLTENLACQSIQPAIFFVFTKHHDLTGLDFVVAFPRRVLQVYLAKNILLVFFLLLVPIIVLFSLFYRHSYYVTAGFKEITARIERLFESTKYDREISFNEDFIYQEFNALIQAFNHLCGKIYQYAQKEKSDERLLAIGTLATQVAHDIRSPLAALAAVEPVLGALPEEQRVLVRRATARIRDIANQLIERSRATQPEGRGTLRLRSGQAQDEGRESTASAVTHAGGESFSIELLSSLIDPLITEKRLQHRMRGTVEIHAELGEGAYGVFAQVQPTEFKRVLSNLVNNAVEGIVATPKDEGRPPANTAWRAGTKDEDGGVVRVRLSAAGQEVKVQVEDNGRGIPAEVLPKLTTRGATFGKAGGSGLGLYHARTTIEGCGGTLALASTVDQGTTVTLTLPRAAPPAWFVPELPLREGMTIVVLDDDQSIHDIWEGRLEALREHVPHLFVRHFMTAEAIIKWYAQQATPSSDVLYLCDYELLGEPSNGLAVIEQLQIQQHAILVTSRYEEPAIRTKCAVLGVRLIPKGLAGFVPLRVTNRDLCEGRGARCEVQRGDSEQRTSHIEQHQPGTNRAAPGYRVLLIDDDADIALTWQCTRRQLGISELVWVRNVEELQATSCELTQFDVVFIDKNIDGSAYNGAATVAYLRAHEARRIVLASGENPDHLKRDPQWAAVDGISPEKVPHDLGAFFA